MGWVVSGFLIACCFILKKGRIMAAQVSKSGYEVLQDTSFLFRKTSTLYLSDEMSDLSILTMSEDGTWKHLPAHRLILAACSLYWKTLLQNKFNLATKCEIKVEHANEDVMKEVLRFVYTGAVRLSVDNVAAVMSAAVQEQLDGLLELCKTFTSKNINFSLCCSVFNIKCIDEELDDIKKQCQEFILNKGDDFATCTETLTNVPQGMMIELVSSTAFKAEEHKVFRMVQEWCAAHAKDRDCKEEMRELYAPFGPLIRYPLLHPHHLDSLVRASGLVSEELLLDAWAVQRGLRTDSHADWTQPRLESLTWHVPWSEVKKASNYFETEVQFYKQQSFYMELYPGTIEAAKSHLSVFFCVKDMSLIAEGHGLKLSWKVTLQNKMDPDRNISIEYKHVFEISNGYGSSEFIKLDMCDGHQSAFQETGAMKFEVRVLEVEVVKIPVKT